MVWLSAQRWRIAGVFRVYWVLLALARIASCLFFEAGYGDSPNVFSPNIEPPRSRYVLWVEISIAIYE